MNTLMLVAALAVPPTKPTPTAATAPMQLKLEVIGRHDGGWWDQSASEIAAYHPGTRRLFVLNGGEGLEVVDISDPTKPTRADMIRCSGLNSVAVHGDVIALASQPKARSSRGTVTFFAPDAHKLSEITVGFNPDMVAFTHDGKRVIVANEGEADDDGTIDPVGSVGVVDLTAGPDKPVYRDLTFDHLEPQRAALQQRGLHIVSPDATLARDLEPEYVAVSADDRRAFVTLQENNAIAVVDLTPGRESVQRIEPLGFKDFMKPGCGLDASDKDGGAEIRNLPVFGLYQPDGVKCLERDGAVWLLTANEGEARERNGLHEAVRFAQLKNTRGPGAALDEASFSAQLGRGSPISVEDLRKREYLGRLEVSLLRGDDDGDGDFDRVFCFGGRSVSLWRVQPDGTITQAWDSGDRIERTVAAQTPEAFNMNSNKSPSRDSRSCKSGPEPESVELADIGGHCIAFVGLERTGGVMAWEMTDPAAPQFLTYLNPRDPSVDLDVDEDQDQKPDRRAQAGDIGPEGLLFLPASVSPDGKPMLVVCNEVSGTTTLLRVKVTEPTPASVP